MGHEDTFPRPRLSARCRISQRTFARTRGTGRDAPNGDIALCVEARARLNSFDFSPRLDDGKEFYSILFRADF